MHDKIKLEIFAIVYLLATTIAAYFLGKEDAEKRKEDFTFLHWFGHIAPAFILLPILIIACSYFMMLKRKK